MATPDRFADAMRALSGPSGGTATAAGGVDDACQVYREWRDELKTIIELIRKWVPNGNQIAAVIEFLMTLADRVCGIDKS